MDFDDAPDVAAFRAKLRDWLATNVPLIEDRGGPLATSRDWQARKAAAGYACMAWPVDWGGGGRPPIYDVVLAQEQANYALPVDYFRIGHGMCLPTVLTVGDAELRPKFGPPGVRGDHVWCQLFSEPAAGSDLAAVRTRAVPAGDGSGDWIVNGQKVWTTVADAADFGLLLCRTDPDLPKHRGLTMFWVDMTTPGIEVRPIADMTGGSTFNEVFLTDVRIPAQQRLGEVNDGWRVSLVTLMNERLSVGGLRGMGWRDHLQLACSTPGPGGEPAIRDRAVRDQLADWYVDSVGLQHLRNRSITALARGEMPGAANAVGKLVAAKLMQDVAGGAIDLLGPSGIVGGAAHPEAHAFHQSWLAAAGLRIAGGTDEILRNIIAERVLGLPPEPRGDKDMPFGMVPTGR